MCINVSIFMGTPQPVGQRRRCPSPPAAHAGHPSVHRRPHSIVQEPRHTCRLDWISSHCTQSSESCQQHPSFLTSSPVWGKISVSRSRRSGLKGENVRNFCYAVPLLLFCATSWPRYCSLYFWRRTERGELRRKKKAFITKLMRDN